MSKNNSKTTVCLSLDDYSIAMLNELVTRFGGTKSNTVDQALRELYYQLLECDYIKSLNKHSEASETGFREYCMDYDVYGYSRSYISKYI